MRSVGQAVAVGAQHGQVLQTGQAFAAVGQGAQVVHIKLGRHLGVKAVAFHMHHMHHMHHKQRKALHVGLRLQPRAARMPVVQIETSVFSRQADGPTGHEFKIMHQARLQANEISSVLI